MIKDYELKHLLKANIENFALDIFSGKTADGLAESLQIMNGIVDRFVDKYKPEPVKPVLPKEVGEELDIAKNEFPFDVYIGNVIDSVSSAKASNHYYIDNTNAIIKLADAWRYGYTVEKESVSLVYVPGTNKCFVYCKRGRWSKQGANSETPVTPQTIATWRVCKGKDESLFEFTDAEITKFGLQDCDKEEATDDEQ